MVKYYLSKKLLLTAVFTVAMCNLSRGLAFSDTVSVFVGDCGFAKNTPMKRCHPKRTNDIESVGISLSRNVDLEPSRYFTLKLHTGVVSMKTNERFDESYSKSTTYAFLGPLLRFPVLQKNHFDLYADLSIGVGFFSDDKFGNTNLGGHFSFRDEVSLGLGLGELKRYGVKLSIAHYSHADLLGEVNPGITIPEVNFYFKF
jgi:hypothetical protein